MRHLVEASQPAVLGQTPDVPFMTPHGRFHTAVAGYSPIADYAIIGDCRSAALISRDGSIDWLCLPRFDSPPLFAAILDRSCGGCFRIAPAGPYTTSRRYVGATAVLETTFAASSGRLRLTDVMPVADEEVKAGSLWPEHELLRLLEVLEGEVEIDVLYAPRLLFGTVPPRIHAQPHQALMVESGRSVLLLRTERALTVNDDGTEGRGRWVMRAGERTVLSLSFAHGSLAVLPAIGDLAWDLVATSIEWWERWAAQCRYDWRYRDQVLRSALTLKLLTYAPSGAIVAAPTTSLPEAIGGVRNWDYRYCWLRDASLTLRALLDLGFTIEAESFLSWLLHATRLTQPKLQILYDVYGEARLPERTIDHVEGYRGSKPVRVGNDAAGQLQLDVYGEVIDGAYQFVVRGGRLDWTTGGVLLRLGRTVCDLWKLPDQGIWEPRSGRRQNTHSKVMCWLALDRLIRLQADGHVRGAVDGFASVRDEIRATVERQAWNAELNSYVATLGGRDLDASLLRLPLCGYVDAKDPRMRSTTARIRTPSPPTGCSIAISSTTGCRATRARSGSAASGAWSASRGKGGSPKRSSGSTRSSAAPTISVCSPKRSTSAPAICSAIFLRPSRTSASSTRRSRLRKSRARRRRSRPREASAYEPLEHRHGGIRGDDRADHDAVGGAGVGVHANEHAVSARDDLHARPRSRYGDRRGRSRRERVALWAALRRGVRVAGPRDTAPGRSGRRDPGAVRADDRHGGAPGAAPVYGQRGTTARHPIACCSRLASWRSTTVVGRRWSLSWHTSCTGRSSAACII